MKTPEIFSNFNKKNKENYLENNEPISYIRKLALVLGIAIASLSSPPNGNQAIYFSNLKNNKEKNEKTLENLEKIKNIFGNYADLGKEKSNNNIELTKLENSIKSFSHKPGTEYKESFKSITDTTHLRDIIEKTYPKGWFNGEISVIEISENEKKFSDDNNDGIEESETWAIFNRRNNKNQIILYEEIAKNHSTFDNINHALSHESAHANDWESDNAMSLEERINLLLAINERLKDKDRYIFEYVENIKNKNEKKERYTKAQEYWAEICSIYFSLPELLNYKDFKLVDGVVKKSDKNFNLKKANMERNMMIDNIDNEAFKKLSEDIEKQKEYDSKQK